MTEPNLADTKAALARLVERGQAIVLPDPIHISAVLDGTVERLMAENADLQARLTAVRQTVFPLLRTPGLVGDLARSVDAEAAPQHHPAA